MTLKDKKYTFFITDQGRYFYRVMLFRLKNIGATYKKMVNKIFKHYIGMNIKVYVCDMIAKSRIVDSY